MPWKRLPRSAPELLVPYKKKLLQQFSKLEQQEVRWHVAPMLARLPLSGTEETAVLDILLSYTNDRSAIVKTMAMQALADIAALNSGRKCRGTLRSLPRPAPRPCKPVAKNCLSNSRKHVAKISPAGDILYSTSIDGTGNEIFQ